MRLLLLIIKKLFRSFELPVQVRDVHKILLVDLNYLGDMLLSSPVYRDLKKNFASARIEAIVYPFSKEAVLANPFVDKVHVVASTSIFLQIPTFFALRKRKYDLAFQLNTSLRTNFLLWITGARYRLGYDYAHRACFNTIRVPIATRTARTSYRIDECLALLEKAFGWKITDREMIFSIPDETIGAVQHLLQSLGISSADLLVGLHTNCRTSQEQRRWEQKKFATLANWLIEKRGAKVLFTGQREDEAYVAPIIREVRRVDRVINLVGRISLTALAVVLRRIDVFITINTGPMHLSISQRTPTVAIIGGTPASVVYPKNDPIFQYVMDKSLEKWNPAARKPKYNPAIVEIEVNEVMQKVHYLLELRRMASSTRN